MRIELTLRKKMKNNLIKYLKNFKSKKILIVGDIMLDHYLLGSVERISPEAPIPVVAVKSERFKLGGGANVASNLVSLGAIPYLIGVVGKDKNSEILIKLLRESKIADDLIISSDEAKTSTKTRVIAHNQHVVRIDNEKTQTISKKVEFSIVQSFNKVIKKVDAVIFEDYNKGLFSKDLIKTLISSAKKYKKPILVDPKKQNFFDFVGCTVFKPNFSEFCQAINISFCSEEEIEKAAKKLLAELNVKYLLLTKGENGMTIFSKNTTYSIPALSKKIFDVSGAGDTVIASFALSFCSGASALESSKIANFAASVVCSKLGVKAVSLEELKKAIKRKDYF